MTGYFGMKKWSFAVEAEILNEMTGWLYNNGLIFEVSNEYWLPTARFRMITVRIVTAPELIIRDIDEALKVIRKNKEWEKSKKG